MTFDSTNSNNYKMKTKFSGILTLLLAFLVQVTFAQEKTISGTVSDENGLPLSGTTVLVKRTNSGASTDFDGNYSINANNEATLVFSFIGYTTQEITIGSSNTINVIMKEDTSVIEEVVITALGIKREKASLGSAVTSIDSEELNEGSQTNISDAIKGKIAGVVISNASTDPGASSGVIIRGFSTISGSNQPLYIVDGIPINNVSRFENDLNGAYDFGRGSNDINPEDIETISVLKGASSTALYGSRAANGVIIITTKQGIKGKLSINFSTSAFFSDVLRVPRYQNQFGQGFSGQHLLDENGSWGPRFTGEILPWGRVVNNSQKIKPYSFQKDQLRNFFDIGTSYVTNAAISGGTENTTGRISFNNTSTDGIFPTSGDSNERNSISVTFSSKIDFLTFGGNLNYVNTKGSAIQAGQGTTVYNNLLQIPNDFDLTEFKDLNDPFNTPENYYTQYGVTNPYFNLKNDGANYEKNRVYGSFNAKAEINNWSNFSYTLGVDQFNDFTEVFTAIIDVPDGSINAGSTETPGSYSIETNRVTQINHDFLYNINLDLSESLNLTSSLGFNYNDRNSLKTNAAVTSQDIPGFYSLSNSSNPATTSTNIRKRRLYGVLNSTQLSYKDMLFLTANIRNDWYSTLPKENRSVLYGGANVSWLATKSFPSIKNILSYGKLRLGYGETGVDTDPYRILPVFLASTSNPITGLSDGPDNQGFRNLNFPVGGVNAFTVGNRAANPKLKPERRKEFEIGTELSFLKNRISLDFTYYDATVEDQILSLPLAATSGFSSQTANIGTISNKGYEALLKLDIFRNPDGFNWNATFNYATNDAILTELDDRVDNISLGGLSTTSLVLSEGQPLALIEGSVPARDPNGNIIVDNNGIPVASPIKEIYGSTQIDYTLGISNDFSYRNFFLGFTIDSRQGGLIFSRTASITRFTGNSITTTLNNREPFIVPGSVQAVVDNTGTTTYVKNTNAVTNEQYNTYFSAEANHRNNVLDKSFVKLREVTFGYKFPKRIIEKTPFEDLSITFVGRNLLLFTPESNQYIDPETSTFGTDLRGQFGEFSSSPSTRSFGVTLKARF